MNDAFSLADKLEREGVLSKWEFAELIGFYGDGSAREYCFEKARRFKRLYYGDGIFMRGLIEISSCCKNDCFYCGIRKSNKNAERYRLSESEIIARCEYGYGLGFRTFVLQGGEDPYYDDARLETVIKTVKKRHPDCAVTLSLGERSRESYKRLREAGADRYLLRHEAADETLYGKIHPAEMSLSNRKRCLYDLKELGYQVGAGFMVGAPFQTAEDIAGDLIFIHELCPEMAGIGPFIPHKDTVFSRCSAGSLELTLLLIAVLRIMLPNALIPATTALGTVNARGREMGILAGANVIMPNLSPVAVRKKYMLYDNKICTGEEAAECVGCLARRMQSVGAKIAVSRGDCAKMKTAQPL